MNGGKILLLNGCSSAGKTTLATTLQSILEPPYMHLALDAFHQMLPDAVLADNRSFNPVWTPLIQGFHRAARAFVAVGFNVILDHVLVRDDRRQDFVAQFADCEVFLIGLQCPLEELERRERLRNDREPGLARWQYPRIHQAMCYDVEVNTSEYSPQACAAFVEAALARPLFPPAFQSLLQMHGI